MTTRRWLVPCVLAACHVAHPRNAPLELHVARDGSDAADGTRDRPFATLVRARDEIRRLHAAGQLPAGAVVDVRAGVYVLRDSFVLDARDSGTPAAPIVYRAEPGTVLLGGEMLRDFAPAGDSPPFDRLPPEARGHVVVANVAGHPGAVYAEGRPLELARWPNDGTVTIAAIADGADAFDVRGNRGFARGSIVIASDRPSRWVSEPDVWAAGAWFWDWAQDRERVVRVDADHGTLVLAGPPHEYGYRAGQWFYVYNVLAELDQPGEWYHDRTTGLLAVWPRVADQPVLVPRVTNLVHLDRASYVTLVGMELRGSVGTGVVIAAGDHDVLSRCVIADTGNWGVEVTGKANAIVDTEIAWTAAGGIMITGGDRETLTAGGNRIERAWIHDVAWWQRTGVPAVRLTGVANEIVDSTIHNAPHAAIEVAGNDHLIAGNDISAVCTEVNDAGAIYGGRDWTMRGSVIRDNYLHDITGRGGRGCNGVYLDDMLSGTSVIGNVFEHVTRAVFIGGGRDNVVESNVFADCTYGIHVDARAAGWAAPGVKTTMIPRLRAMPIVSEVWRRRYPELPAMLDDHPELPAHNRFVGNVAWHTVLAELDPAAGPLVDLTASFTARDDELQRAHGRLVLAATARPELTRAIARVLSRASSPAARRR